MADEVVDGLVIQSRFDESGLDRSVQAELVALKQFVSSVGALADRIPPLDLEVGPIAQALAEAGGNVHDFFAGLREGITEGINEAQALTQAIRAVPPAPVIQPQQTPNTDITTQLRVEQITAISLSRALSEVGLATRALTNIPPVTLDTKNAVNAAGTLIERLGLTAKSVQTVQQALSGASLGPPSGLREVIGILEPIPATAQQAAAALAQMGAGLEGASTQAQSLSASTRDTIAFNERLAKAAEQAATGLTAQAQAALAAAKANAAVQAAGGGANLGAAAGALAQANTLAAASSVARSGAEKMAAGLAIAAQQATILAAAEAQAVTGAGRMAAGFAGAAAQAKALAASEQAAAAANVAVGTGASSATKGLNLMRGATVGLATQALGSTGAVGSLAAGLLFLAEVPNPVIIAIAALVIGMQALEGPTKKAREEVDAFIKQLKEAEKARLSPFAQAGLTLDEIKQKATEAKARIAALQAQAAAQGKGGGLIFGGSIDAEQARLKDLERQLNVLIPLREKLLADDTAAIRAAQQASREGFVQELAAAPSIGTDTAGSIRERAAEMARLNAIVRDSSASLAERNKAAQDFNRLLDGSLFKTERQLQLDQQGAQAALQRFQQLRQQAAGLGADVSVKLDVADAEDGLRRFQGTIAADLAEVNRLRAGLDSNSAAAQRLADKAAGLTGLRDAIKQIIDAAHPTGLQALVESVDAVGRRLTALRAISDGSAASQRDIAASAGQAALQYAALAVEIERAGGASQADTRLLDAQAQAFRNLGDGTGALVAGLAVAIGQLRQVSVDAGRAGDALGALPDDTRIRLTLDTGPATVSLQDFVTRTAQDVAIQAELQLRVKAAEDELAAFQSSAGQDATVGVNLRANVTQAQAALDAFRDGVAHRAAVIPVRADVSEAESQVEELLRRLRERNQKKEQVRLGNVDLPPIGDEIPRAFDAAQQSVDGLNGRLTEAASASNKFFRDAVRGAEDTRTHVQKLNDEIHGITRGLDSIAGVARNIGLIGDTADAAISSVLNLGDAIGNVIESASAGNILGLIGSGINAISGIGHALGIGQSESERILAQAVKSNEAALHEATRAYEKAQGRFEGAGGIADQQKILSDVLARPDAQAALNNSDLDAFRNAVEATGISLDALREIARANGISLVQDHHLVEGGTDALRRALELAALSATTFGQTFDEQSRKAELRARLVGDTQTPEAQFSRQVDVASQFSDAIAQAFGTVDLSDDAAVRKAAVDLFDRFASGKIKAEDLGLSKEDFLAFLDNAAGFLDSFGNSVAEANKQISNFNLPSGFKTERLAFQASDPGQFTPTAAGALSAEDLAAIRATAVEQRRIPPAAPVVHVTFQPGALVQQVGESTAEFADRVIDAMRAKMMAQSGDTLNFSFN